MSVRNLALHLLLVSTLALCALALSSPAQAQGTSQLQLFLDAPQSADLGGTTLSENSDDQYVVTEGDTLTFTGTINNLPTDPEGVGEDITLNGDNISSSSTVITDDSDYQFVELFDSPLTPTGPGDTTGDNPLFTLDVPTTPEILTGTFEVDGTDPSGNAVTPGTASFTLDIVAPAGAATPEPSQLVLLLVGMAMLGGLVLWRRRAVWN